MKMADGGFRPAYNVQLATDVGSNFIVGVDVSNIGSDMMLMPPMLTEIERRMGKLPNDYLVDGGFAGLEAIEDAHTRGVTVYAPLQESKDGKRRRKQNVPAIAQWRERMATDTAKMIYRQRASTAELVNADLRAWRGLTHLRVRGLHRVRAAVYLAAFTHNLRRAIRLPS
jgi:IS5 family transposase